MSNEEATQGVCWKFALACMLGVKPKYVPHFVTDKSVDYMQDTRVWLAKKHKKGLVYIPINQFMETFGIRQNPTGGPDGYSIMSLSTDDADTNHVVIAYDGKLFHDPCESDLNTFRVPLGYFVLYDL